VLITASHLLTLQLTTVNNVIAEFQKMVGFRLSQKEHENLEALVTAGKFKTISAGVRAAVTEFIEKQPKGSSP
jgi:carbamate kinase